MSLTHEQIDDVLEALATGCDNELAEDAAGLDRGALAPLLAADPELDRKARRARAKFEVECRAALIESRPAFLLERTLPEKYAPTAHRPLKEDEGDTDGGLFGDGTG